MIELPVGTKTKVTFGISHWNNADHCQIAKQFKIGEDWLPKTSMLIPYRQRLELAAKLREFAELLENL